MTPDVFLGVPTYDNTISIHTATGIMQAAVGRNTQVAFHGSSLLAHGFNQLFASGIMSGAEYFAMCHADIGPEPRWLDTLIDELESTGADLLSVVIPIKSDEQLYSVALAEDNSEVHYRLSEDDYAQLPETFDGDALREVTGYPGELCVNTGLWVCRAQAEWCKQVSFQIRSKITWDNGEPRCVILPEDWDFSWQLHRLGLRVLATSKVAVIHAGNHTWTNTVSDNATATVGAIA